MRTFEHLEKTKLELLRFQCIHIIKRMPETVIVLIRKSGDQVQMLMNISKAVDPLHNSFQFPEIHGSVDCLNCVRICGLYSDFKLDQPGTHSGHFLQFFFSQQICGNLKVEIRHSIIMLINVLPDCHCMVMFTVKSTVYKLHLRNLIIYEKLQLFLHHLRISETQLLINGRKTIAT